MRFELVSAGAPSSAAATAAEVAAEEWSLAAGREWLWSWAYVTMSFVGSTRLLSTCFLAGQPLELLHR